MILGKKYNEINLAYNKVLENIQAMKEYDHAHPLEAKEEKAIEKVSKKEGEEEKEEEKGEEKGEEKEEKGKESDLTKEEEESIVEYEKLLEKILKQFQSLKLMKSKQEFLQTMKEQGISPQDSKTLINRGIRGKTKRVTKKLAKTERNALKTEENENKNNDEEDDISSVDHDKKILAKFIKEQKKEIDEFINVKKQPNAPKPTNGK